MSLGGAIVRALHRPNTELLQRAEKGSDRSGLEWCSVTDVSRWTLAWLTLLRFVTGIREGARDHVNIALRCGGGKYAALDLFFPKTEPTHDFHQPSELILKNPLLATPVLYSDAVGG